MSLKCCVTELIQFLCLRSSRPIYIFIYNFESSGGNHSTSTLSRSSSSVSSSRDEDSRDSQQNDNTSQKSDSSHGSDSPWPSNFVVKVAGTTDTVRLKCRELLANAFKCGGRVLLAFSTNLARTDL